MALKCRRRERQSLRTDGSACGMWSRDGACRTWRARGVAGAQPLPRRLERMLALLADTLGRFGNAASRDALAAWI